MSPDAFESVFISLARPHARRRAIAKRRNIDNCSGSVKRNALEGHTAKVCAHGLAG